MRLLFALCILIPWDHVLAQGCDQLERELKSGNLAEAFELAGDAKATQSVQCLNLSGQAYLQKGAFDEALSIFEKAEGLALSNTSEKANSLNNIGLTQYSLGNYEKAVSYLQRAYDIRSNLTGNNKEEIAASLNDLGFVLTSRDPDQALKYYEKSLSIYKEVLGGKNQKVAQSLLNAAIIYLQLELYGEATINLEEALAIWQELFPEGHPNEGIIYYYLAENSKATNQSKAELQYLELSRASYLKHYGAEHPETAFILTRIGNHYNEQGEFKKALSLYQGALIANTPDWSNENIDENPPVSNYYKATTQLSTLYYKARAFMDKYYIKSRKFADLKLSLKTLQSCDSLIDEIRKLRTSESDKLELGRSSNLVYELGTILCDGMTEVVAKKDQYFKLAFYFAEKSKSAVLLEAISDASAKSYANIPQSETDRELTLKTDITFWEQQLAKEVSSQNIIREKLFSLNAEYDEFVDQLETKYPAYYNLKYNVTAPNVEQIQELLDENTLILSYFIASEANRLFTFEISKNSFSVNNQPIDENLYRYMNGLRNSLYYQEDNVFKLTATSLYNQLIPKRMDKKITDLVIIPSGRLGTMPFETLLESNPKSDDYSQFPYLISKYNISYQYALALYYQNKNKAPSSTNGALLCAPVNFSALPNLPATLEEVSNLGTILQKKAITSKSMLMAEANESNVKAGGLDQYNYLHFATHGVVDAQNPQNSRIFLGSGANDDGELFSSEIYNLNLNASLVTLSACETGLGKLSEGEGIIGLSRALLYAGANNLVVSLWSVSDKSTADLMVDFYSEIDGDQYSRALRTAKLKMIQSSEYSKPFYWAPFILIGD